MKTHYETLGIQRTATIDEIKKAYRKKAKEFHPDTSDHADAEERFKEINEAYDILKDEQRREEYDNPYGYRGGEPGMGFSPNSPYMGRRRSPHNSHNTIRGNVGIPVDVMINGGTMKVPIQVPTQMPNNQYAGSIFGMQMTTEIVSITVEPDTPVGTTVVLTPDNHGIDGIDNIILRLFPQNSDGGDYHIEGHDIYMPLTVDVFAAMLGESITISLPTGNRIKVALPRGAASGKSIRLVGKGLSGLGGHKGDVYLIVTLEIPDVSDEQLEQIKTIIRPDTA